MSAPYWAHVGQFWCILWFALAFVGQELGPYWAYLGPFWDMLGHFGPRWHHTSLMLSHLGIFWDLDLGISVSLNFRPCNAFAKNIINTLFLPISIWYDRWSLRVAYMLILLASSFPGIPFRCSVLPGSGEMVPAGEATHAATWETLKFHPWFAIFRTDLIFLDANDTWAWLRVGVLYFFLPQLARPCSIADWLALPCLMILHTHSR